MNFVAIDFETANAKRTSACSIGVCIVKNGSIQTTYSTLLKPEPFDFQPINISIHGIKKEDVLDAPTFLEAWEGIYSSFEDLPIVAHNAAFDMSVLRHCLDLNQQSYPNLDYLCTLVLSRKLKPELGSHRLDYLSDYYGIELDHHIAESDAKACAEVLLNLSAEANASCINDLKKVISFGGLWHTDDCRNNYCPCRKR